MGGSEVDPRCGDALATNSNGRVLAIGNPGEFPDICDDSLILHKSGSRRHRCERANTLAAPIIAADIARFGEDETVVLRCEGGWMRVYLAHHKADTMTTAGHIAKLGRTTG